MTIEDFETTDVGYYICTAQNLQGATTVATTVEFSWLGKWSIMNWWKVHLCPWPALGFFWLMLCPRLMSSAKPHPLPCESDPDIQTKRKSSALIIEVLTPRTESMYFDCLPIYMHFYFIIKKSIDINFIASFLLNEQVFVKNTKWAKCSFFRLKYIQRDLLAAMFGVTTQDSIWYHNYNTWGSKESNTWFNSIYNTKVSKN